MNTQERKRHLDLVGVILFCSTAISLIAYFCAGLIWSLASGKYIRNEPGIPKELHLVALILYWVGFISMAVAMVSTLHIRSEENDRYED